jgi:hypothetical protein
MIYDDSGGPARSIRKLTRDAAARMIAANGGDPRIAFQGAEPTMRGADALAEVNRQAARDGQVASDYLDRLDELERRSLDLELLDDYARALGLSGLGGVRHVRGTS